MDIYIYFFALLLLGLIPKPTSKSHWYLLFFVAFLFAIVGFRDVSVGYDTMSYVEDFQRCCNLSWSQVFAGALKQREPLFGIVVGVISRITNWYPAYLMFWALFPTIALYSIFKNELGQRKIDILLAIIVLFNLGIIAFFQAGVRQTAAMSILLLASRNLSKIDNTHSFSFLRDKNFYLFLLWLFMAYGFHNSSIVFILALLIKDIKIRWWFMFMPIAIYVISSNVQLDYLIWSISLFFQDNQYSQYGTSYESQLSLSGFIMQIILFLLCFIPRKNTIKNNPQTQALYIYAIMGLVFASLTGLIAEMYRVSFYWSMFYIILLPRAFEAYNSRIRDITYIGFIIGSLIYLFALSTANLTEFAFF